MDKNLFYAVDEQGKEYPFTVLEVDGRLHLTLKKETFWRAKQLRLLPALGRAMAGDEGYWILPRNIGMLGEIQTLFRPRADVTFSYESPVMSWYGIKKAGLCCVVRVERNYHYRYEGVVKDNVYTVCPLFDFTVHDKVYDDIRLEIIPLEESADYNDMARAERTLRLSRDELVPLTEKCRRPAVEYARKYPVVRIRMGWKQSPSPVWYQTEENEPPMHVACDFARVRDLADELKRQGVEGVELQLVGWQRGGHDGRYPQLFPAEPQLGGNEGLRQTIDHVKALGYRISTHTNTIDSYPLADSFTWDDVVVDRDGEYNQTGHHCAGLAFHVCPCKQLKNAMRDLPLLATYGENGLHFTDVISIVEPDDCHAPDHPSSAANGVLYAQQNIRYTKGLFGGFSSEGCMDFALRDLDFGLYVTFGNGAGKNDVPICDNYLPVWEVAYHGTVLYNPISTTVNYTVQSPADRLILVLRGGKAAMYMYSKFRSGVGGINWMGEGDLCCATDEELRWSVGKIREAAEEQARLADLQLVYIKRYDVLGDGLEMVTYENGTRIVGNFSDGEKCFEGKTVGAYDYVVIK